MRTQHDQPKGPFTFVVHYAIAIAISFKNGFFAIVIPMHPTEKYRNHICNLNRVINGVKGP